MITICPRTGRPPVDGKTKAKTFQARLSEDDINDMNYCAEKLDITNAEVLRKGIKLVKSEINKK